MRADGRWLKFLARNQSREQEEHAAANHLLSRCEKRQVGVFRGTRIKGTDRPKERCDEQDEHSNSWMARFVAEKCIDGSIKIPTPMNPPASPSQTGSLGRGVAPVAHESSTIKIGTVATITAASPVSTYCSAMVTPPLPPSSKNPPTIRELRHVMAGGRVAPRARAIP